MEEIIKSTTPPHEDNNLNENNTTQSKNKQPASNLPESRIKSRESNFELLRIVAMILIIFSHVRTSFDGQNVSDTTQSLYYTITSFGQVGVTLFILISSYFLCTKKFNFTSIFKILLEVIFYSFISAGLHLLFIEPDMSIVQFIKSLVRTPFIVSKGEWWFASSYFVFYLIFPFLNCLLEKINKREHLLLLSILLLAFSIYYSFTYDTIEGGVTPVFFFIIVYFIGAFIRKYPEYFKNKALIYIMTIVSFVMYSILRYESIFSMTNRNAFTILTLSVFLFLTFSTFRFKSKIVNVISSTTFGIYLLHECLPMWTIIWEKIFKMSSHAAENTFLLRVVLCVIIVFVACSICDLLRIYLLEKPLFKLLKKNKIYKKIETAVNNFYPSAVMQLQDGTSAVAPSSSILTIFSLTYISFIFCRVFYPQMYMFYFVEFGALGLYFLLKRIKHNNC